MGKIGIMVVPTKSDLKAKRFVDWREYVFKRGSTYVSVSLLNSWSVNELAVVQVLQCTYRFKSQITFLGLINTFTLMTKPWSTK